MFQGQQGGHGAGFQQFGTHSAAAGFQNNMQQGQFHHGTSDGNFQQFMGANQVEQNHGGQGFIGNQGSLMGGQNRGHIGPSYGGETSHVGRRGFPKQHRGQQIGKGTPEQGRGQGGYNHAQALAIGCPAAPNHVVDDAQDLLKETNNLTTPNVSSGAKANDGNLKIIVKFSFVIFVRETNMSRQSVHLREISRLLIWLVME